MLLVFRKLGCLKAYSLEMLREQVRRLHLQDTKVYPSYLLLINKTVRPISIQFTNCNFAKVYITIVNLIILLIKKVVTLVVQT